MKNYLVSMKVHYDCRCSDSVFLQTAKNMQEALNRIIEKNSEYFKDKLWVVQSICVCDKSITDITQLANGKVEGRNDTH